MHLSNGPAIDPGSFLIVASVNSNRRSGQAVAKSEVMVPRAATAVTSIFGAIRRFLIPLPSREEQERHLAQFCGSLDAVRSVQTELPLPPVSPSGHQLKSRPHVRAPHRRTPRHPGPRTRMTPKTAGWDELHLSENPAVELLESLGYTYLPPEDLEPERASIQGDHPRRPPRRRPQAPEPLALRDQHRHGYQGGHPGPRDQSRRGQREALHLPHLRHRAGTGPRRRTEEPHRQIPRLRQP